MAFRDRQMFVSCIANIFFGCLGGGRAAGVASGPSSLCSFVVYICAFYTRINFQDATFSGVTLFLCIVWSFQLVHFSFCRVLCMCASLLLLCLGLHDARRRKRRPAQADERRITRVKDFKVVGPLDPPHAFQPFFWVCMFVCR